MKARKIQQGKIQGERKGRRRERGEGEEEEGGGQDGEEWRARK